MKIDIKKPEFNRKKKQVQEIDPEHVVFAAANASAEEEDGSFGVNVRNEEGGVKLLGTRNESSWWLRELPHEIATIIAILSLPALLMSAAGYATAIPFLLAGVIVYMVMVVLGDVVFEDRIKYFTAIGIFVVLVLTFILLRKYVWGGIALTMNGVYDASETEQAYIYDRIGLSSGAEEDPIMCIRMGANWISSLLGMLAALPITTIRRTVGIGFVCIGMIAFAYYGLLPSAALVAVIALAVIFVLARGGLLAVLPVILASLLLFGAVMAISPGENYGISRMDENMRDRLAFKSVYLKSNVDQETPQEIQHRLEQQQEEEDENEGYGQESKHLVVILVAVLLLAALAAAAYLLYRRYRKMRDANRAGIDSDDPRTAIVAMFPYAVKWLGAADLDVHGKRFATLIEPLHHDVSDQYSNYFKSMYVLWREAAYSDHEMEIEKRDAMKEFLDDTKDMVNRDLNLGGKIKSVLKYAL